MSTSSEFGMSPHVSFRAWPFFTLRPAVSAIQKIWPRLSNWILMTNKPMEKNKQLSRSLTWFSLHCWNLKLWTKFIDIHRSSASKENKNESLLEGLPHLLHVFPLWTFQPCERNPSNEPCQASNEAAPLLCFGIIHVMLGNRNQETFDHLEAKPQKIATSDVQVTNRVYKQEYVATHDRNLNKNNKFPEDFKCLNAECSNCQAKSKVLKLNHQISI